MAQKLYLEDAAIRITRNPDNQQQIEFLKATEPFVLFSGGVGAGKTAAFVWRAIALSSDSSFFGDMSGNVGLMGRYSMTSFMNTTYREVIKWLPRSWVRKYYKKDGMLELKNESVIHFTHFDTMEHLHSYNVGWVGIDQFEQVPEEVFKGLAYERIRLTALNQFDSNGRPLDPPAHLDYQTVFATCNPKRGWVYDLFVKNEEFRKAQDDRVRARYNPNYRLISVTTHENQRFLPTGYTQRQRTDMSEREYRRRVMGEWDAFEGQVYEDFNDDLVLEENRIPHPSWKFYVGIDHGGTGSVPANRSINITSVVFAAVKERKGDWPLIHVFDELTLQSSTIEETVEAIDNKLKGIATAMRMHYPRESTDKIGERIPVTAWRCDPSMNRRTGGAEKATVETTAEAYMRHAALRGFNMPLAMGDNSVNSGIQKVSWLFRKGLIIVNPSCSDFITAHQTYEYGNNEQPAKGQFDHPCDAGRYMLSAVPFWWSDFRLPDDNETIVDKELRRLKQKEAYDGLDPIYGNRYSAYGI